MPNLLVDVESIGGVAWPRWGGRRGVAGVEQHDCPDYGKVRMIIDFFQVGRSMSDAHPRARGAFSTATMDTTLGPETP